MPFSWHPKIIILIDGSVFKECGNPFKNHPNSPEKKIPKI
jgi:hypothetical protein